MEFLKAAAAAAGTCASCTASKKQLVALQGVMDGLVCKVNGLERALQDCELELAERDLQVVLLKSFISNMGSPSELEHFQEVLQHNSFLQQQLQQLSCTTASHGPAATAAASAPSTAVQVSLLRSALAEANFRLTAAGLTPVAATTLQDTASTPAQAPSSLQQPRAYSTSAHTTPALRPLSFSRFLHKYSTAANNPATHSSNTSIGTKNTLLLAERISSASSSSSTSSASSCAPALSLVSQLSGTATPTGGPGSSNDGPDTPAALGWPAPALTPASTYASTDSTHSHPAAPAAGAATAVAAAAAVANLNGKFSAAAAPGVQTLPLAGGSICLQDHTPQIAFANLNMPAAQIAASLQALGSSSINVSTYSKQPASQSTTSTAAASPGHVIAAYSTPGAAGTPPCSPCSSISCGSPPTRPSFFAAAVQLPPGVHALPGVMSSCDNPLFACEDDEEL